MSLNEVIKRLRDAAASPYRRATSPAAVTSLQCTEGRTYQGNPHIINRVTPDTCVTSKQDECRRGSEPGLSESSAGAGLDRSGKSENGELMEHEFSRNERSSDLPLSEPELVALITRTARRFELCPADLWAWLSVDDLDALRSGDP